MKKLNTETLGNEKQINMEQIAPQLIEEDLPSAEARPPTSNSKHRPIKAGVFNFFLVAPHRKVFPKFLFNLFPHCTGRTGLNFFCNLEP